MHWSWHRRPESQWKSQEVPLQVGVAPFGAVHRCSQPLPQESMLMLLLHCCPHWWNPERHLNPHDFPSQVASASGGGSQGKQPVPQLLVSVSETQLPLQSCLPAAHWPLHDCAEGMQAPAQSFVPAGHSPPHLLPSHVALPPLGVSQAVHELPQVAGSVLATQASPHLW